MRVTLVGNATRKGMVRYHHSKDIRCFCEAPCAATALVLGLFILFSIFMFGCHLLRLPIGDNPIGITMFKNDKLGDRTALTARGASPACSYRHIRRKLPRGLRALRNPHPLIPHRVKNLTKSHSHSVCLIPNLLRDAAHFSFALWGLAFGLDLSIARYSLFRVRKWCAQSASLASSAPLPRKPLSP